LALAEQMPDATLVGVDIKGSRIWHGAKRALDESVDNAKFLRTRIEDLKNYFEDGEVDEIWITFPDPHPRDGKAKKRLSSPRFLDIYKDLLKPGGSVHLKTDNELLFNYTLEVLSQEKWKIEEQVDDVYAEEVEYELLHIQTQYEKRHLAEGRRISYVRFINY